MVTISYDTWRTFSSLGGSLAIRRRSLPGNRYLWGYGVPASFTTVCVLVAELAGGQSIRYGSAEMCFISEGRFYYFALPIGACVICNGAAFSLTVAALSRHAKGAETVRRSAEPYWPVYLRMSTLMGFTWAFGFLAMATGWSPLWYAFVACNSAQGVFVFASFAMGRQSRELWTTAVSNSRLLSSIYSGRSEATLSSSELKLSSIKVTNQ